MGCKLERMEPFTRALNKSHLIAAGFTYEELEKPIIAIANSWNEFNHGHTQQNELVKFVKKGILAAGGTPIEFHTPGPCDGLAVGNEGMHFILPTRELIADVIEATISGHPIFDGLVLMSSCDKITPGMLIAAARLDMPTIHIAGGPSIPAITFAESKRLRSEFLKGNITEKELAEGNAELYATPGNCPYIGTANTMNVFAEAVGMALPGSALAPAISQKRILACWETGLRIVELAKQEITSRRIMTKEAFYNALSVLASLGGSSNYTLHVPAIAKRLNLDISRDDLDSINVSTPLLSRIAPNGSLSVVDLDRAGGVPAVMNELKDLLNLDCVTVSGKTIKEIIQTASSIDGDVIRQITNPFESEGGMRILYGNLAPKGAVVKSSAVPKEMWVYEGPAYVFENEQRCISAAQKGEIQDGSVLVLKYEGPKGGPGMREMHRLVNVLKANETQIALITDGRFSGADYGLMVGYISPEAADGGPIGVIADGDLISINLFEKTLNLKVLDEALKNRLASFHPSQPSTNSELLKKYSERVGLASEGANW